MAVVAGSKQLAQIHGNNAPTRTTEVLLSLPEGDNNLAADTRHPLDTLGLKPVVDARSGGRRMVMASAWGPKPVEVDVIGETAQDYGLKVVASGKHNLKLVRWPRLLERL